MKKLLTIAMITLAAVAAKADLYLYWTVDVGEFTDASYAVLENANGKYVASMTAPTVDDATGKSPIASAYFISSIDYYVALYDSSFTKIAISGNLSYSDVVAHTYAASGDVTEPPSNVSSLSVSGFTSTIPEPTSALMLLLGLGALALKRKVA